MISTIEMLENVKKLNEELLDFLDKKGLLTEFYQEKLLKV